MTEQQLDLFEDARAHPRRPVREPQACAARTVTVPLSRSTVRALGACNAHAAAVSAAVSPSAMRDLERCHAAASAALTPPVLGSMSEAATVLAASRPFFGRW